MGRRFVASDYAVFDTTLEIIWTGMFYKTLYAEWLPNSGYDYRENLNTAYFKWASFSKYPAIEVYPKGWENTKSAMQVYIPVVKK